MDRPRRAPRAAQPGDRRAHPAVTAAGWRGSFQMSSKRSLKGILRQPRGATVIGMATNDPSIDPGARERLRLRFGADVAAWFDRLPGLLTEISSRWPCEIGAAIPRGCVSTVFHCRAP